MNRAIVKTRASRIQSHHEILIKVVSVAIPMRKDAIVSATTTNKLEENLQ